MVVVTCYNRVYEDEFTVCAETFEEVKKIALSETDKRGWNRSDCWSEVKET